MKQSGLIVCLAILIAPGTAPAGYAPGYEVHPLDQDRFEVISTVGPSPSLYWCGAANYATRTKSKPTTQRIHVWRARGDSIARPGKTAVQFSFAAPSGIASRSSTISVEAAGTTLSVAQARTHCDDKTIRD